MTDQANFPQEPTIAADKTPSEAELRYFYFGFYRSLSRYRSLTIIGWVVVVIGCLSFPVGWSVGRPGGIIDIALSCATIVAGLGLVSQSISSLESYMKITLPFTFNDGQHPLVHDAVDIMKDVDEGGWQEAYAAIRKMEDLQKKYGLPPLR